MSRPVAALYVAAKGCYYGLGDVEPWGLPERDAREYAGPHPVVAHPPCARWGRYALGGPSHYGRFKVGDDGGCFAAALASVRRWGGYWSTPPHRWHGPLSGCQSRCGMAGGRAVCAAGGPATSSRGTTVTGRARRRGCTPLGAICRGWPGARRQRPRGSTTGITRPRSARQRRPAASMAGETSSPTASATRPRTSFATCYWRWRAARDHGECGARRARSSDVGCDE